MAIRYTDGDREVLPVEPRKGFTKQQVAEAIKREGFVDVEGDYITYEIIQSVIVL